MKPDFGLTSDDYARHRAGFPDSLFERLAARSIGQPGQRVVDLGTGTGSLARGFARRGCRVVGIDPAEPMLRAAREIDAREDVAVEYRVARAEQTGLPGLRPEQVDAFDARLADLLASRYPGERLLVPHRVFAVVARAPEGGAALDREDAPLR